jgi:hypothetical protein
MMKRVVCLLLALLSFGANTSFAERTIFVMTPTIRAPQHVLPGSEVITEYRVTNNTPMTLANDVIFEVPTTGFTQVTAVANPCIVPFTLAAGASCTLRYLIDTSVLPTQFHLDGPEVCHNGTRIRCSLPQPQDRITIAQSDSHASLANISIPANNVEWPIAETTILTVTNNSSISANNVKLTLTPALQAVVTNVDDSECVNITPFGTCNMRITVAQHANPITSTISVAGVNTNTVQATVRVVSVFLQVSPNPIGFSDPAVSQIMDVSNVTDLAVDITAVTLNGLVNFPIANVDVDDCAGGAFAPLAFPITVPQSASPPNPGTPCKFRFTANASSYGTTNNPGASFTQGSVVFTYEDTVANPKAIAGIININKSTFTISNIYNNNVIIIPYTGVGGLYVVSITNNSLFDIVDFDAQFLSLPSMPFAFIIADNDLCPRVAPNGGPFTLDAGASCVIDYRNVNPSGATPGENVVFSGSNLITRTVIYEAAPS